MHDLKWIRANPADFDGGLKRRGMQPHSAEILALDEENRAHIAKLQEMQTRRNAVSKQIGKAKGSGDEAKAKELMDEVASLKEDYAAGEKQGGKIADDLNALLASLPNIPLDEVPDGGGEADNVVTRTEGEKPSFSFTPKEHFDLGEDLGMLDFETAAKMSGARFAVLSGPLARLERALAAFMLDIHTTEYGYTEVVPPILVRDEAVFGTAQLPKFAEDLFRTENGYWLIPTAEVPLTNMVREQILAESELPKRFAAHTPCFRSEAGSAGKDTRGLIRMHQFSKVEMVSVVHPREAMDELERMTGCAEEILKRLGLAYQVLTLCTGDMGFTARKTYDLEVWLPGQDSYREISSCSVCGDFQTRRMKTRFREAGGKTLHFPHTLNGSGLAVGRTMVAVLENYQQEDGSIMIPEALRSYMGGLEKIEKS